jgi:hypothetical protein
VKVTRNRGPLDPHSLQAVIEERESILATLEILDNPKLPARLAELAKTLDQDVAADRLLGTADVFDA